MGHFWLDYWGSSRYLRPCLKHLYHVRHRAHNNPHERCRAISLFCAPLAQLEERRHVLFFQQELYKLYVADIVSTSGCRALALRLLFYNICNPCIQKLHAILQPKLKCPSAVQHCLHNIYKVQIIPHIRAELTISFAELNTSSLAISGLISTRDMMLAEGTISSG